MTFDLITGTATITSGGAASGIAYTFHPSAGTVPCKIVRFYGTMGTFTPLVSGNIVIYADTNEVLYQSASVAPSSVYNFSLDYDVFPNYAVKITSTGDIGNGNPFATVKIQVEK